MSNDSALATLNEQSKEISLLAHTGALLGWDQETYMPPAAIEERGQQQALISALIHQRITSDTLGKALEDLGVSEATPFGRGDLSWNDQRSLRALMRAYTRHKKIPEKFVREEAATASSAQAAWIKAREANDFQAFLPHLEKTVELSLQKAEYLGYKNEAYDALLDQYEPDSKAEDVARAFTSLAKELVPLVEAIVAKPAPDDSFLQKSYPLPDQEAFSKHILTAMGYDFSMGRLDVVAHPFCTTLGRKDVRTTTHYYEKDFTKSLYSVIHEGGHALYEMGFADDLPDSLADGTSLGIHESQSRTWENMIGRSRPFWQKNFAELKTAFPSQLAGVSADDVWRAVNKVEKSLIRIYADEVTYSLHIMLRFNLELSLMRKDLKPRDIPAAWNDESKRLLGIVPPTDADGCMQDVHWSMGGIGYFPTYALGNLYGAMFMEKAQSDIPDLWTRVGNGDLATLRGWLKTNIHAFGSAKTPQELLQDVCGKPLDHSAFMSYLKKKYTELYQL